MKKILVICGIASLFVGCTHKVHLGYTPICPPREKNNIELAMNAIQDTRKTKDQVGAMRNIYWMPLVTIKTDDSVPNWVSSALKQELTNVGYTVKDDADYKINGTIHRLSVNSHFLYHGRLAIELQLLKNNQTIFSRTYSTKKTPGINWFAQATTCLRTLEMNLQEVCKQFIHDLDQHTLAKATSQ